MSYSTAKKLFADANRLTNAKSDPLMFNLSNGLHTLTAALEAENQELQTKLDRIEKLLREIRAK
jgi:hypothetical protein